MNDWSPFEAEECSGGRPALFSQARAAKILQAVRQGLTYKQAAAYAGVSYSTLNRWRIEGRRREGDGSEIWKFWKALQEANGEAAFRLLGRINEAAEGGDWKAATWILERRFRDEWGSRPANDIDPEEAMFPD